MRASSFFGGVVRESLLREVGCGERWIPACAGMTEGVASYNRARFFVAEPPQNDMWGRGIDPWTGSG